MSQLTIPDSMFGPKEVAKHGKTRGPMKSAFVDQVPVHLVPKGTSQETKSKLALAYMMTGSSTSKSLLAWKQYVASYSVLMFPSL